MLAFALAVTACSSDNRAAPSSDPALGAPAPQPNNVGSLDLALDLAPGIRLDSIDYDLSGAVFSKQGTLDVSHSSTVSAVIGGVPFATGYVLTLHGATVGTPELSCTGKTNVDVTGPGLVPVNVHLLCMTAAHASPVPVPAPAVAAFGILLLGAGSWMVRRTPSTRRIRKNS
jgi:hypothetical protein